LETSGGVLKDPRRLIAESSSRSPKSGARMAMLTLLVPEGGLSALKYAERDLLDRFQRKYRFGNFRRLPESSEIVNTPPPPEVGGILIAVCKDRPESVKFRRSEPCNAI
jgi:hypothetical protein